MRSKETKQNLRQAKQLKAKIQALTKPRRAIVKGQDYKTSVLYSQDFNGMLDLAEQLRPIETELIKAHIGYMPFLEH